jgi:hypothetical protein
MSIIEPAFYYRFNSTRFNYNYKNRFLAVFLVIYIKKPVLYNYIIFADISLVRRSLFARFTPCYRSHNSNGVIIIKIKRFRIFAFSLNLARITSSCTSWWRLVLPRPLRGLLPRTSHVAIRTLQFIVYI